jgi:diaminopimelate decarboxylase
MSQFRIDEALSIRGDRLYIEECDTVALADRFGTPVHVISEDQLRRNARRFRNEFQSRWAEGQVIVMPSIKANFTLATRRILSDEGLGCDTFGLGELFAALEGGVDPALISVNGSIKDKQLIERAVSVGARITLDSARELDLVEQVAKSRGRRAVVRFRLRPEYSELDLPTDWYEEEVPMSLATQLYKAGIPTADVRTMGKRALAMDAIDLRGVHLHVGRHTPGPEQWPPVIAGYVRLIAQLSREWDGWQPREINLGGGYPLRRDPFGRGMTRLKDRKPGTPPLADYAEVVTRSLRRELDANGLSSAGVRLEIEPGRAIYGDAGIHLARVHNIKSQKEPIPLTWVETDTSDMFLPDVVWEHNRWTIIAANRASQPTTETVDIVGLSCQPDRIVPETRVPKLDIGDLLAFLDTGAYQDGLASNFNALPRPGTVLVHGQDAELIKRAETVEDIFDRDLVPERLRARSPLPAR